MRLCQGGRLIRPPSRRVRPSSAAGLQSDLCLGQSATWHSLDRPDQEIDSIKANGKLLTSFPSLLAAVMLTAASRTPMDRLFGAYNAQR